MTTYSLKRVWFTPVLAELLANRRDGIIFTAVGGLQLALYLAGLPAWTCPIKATLGIPCPGCGLTTAMGELLHGEIQESFHTHAFAPVFLLILFVMLLSVILPRTLRESLLEHLSDFEKRTGITALVLSGLMLYWGFRLFGLV